MPRLLAVVALSAALSGAACMSRFSQRDELLTAVDEFNDGIRWGNVERSARHLPLELRKAFLARYSALEEDLEILDYEVMRVEMNPAISSADVRVAISWSLKRRGILERTIYQQHWEQKGNAWLMTKQAHLRGAPLALID